MRLAVAMNLGFLDKALDGLEGKDLGKLVDTLQQAAARTLEFDGEYPAQQARRLPQAPELRLRMPGRRDTVNARLVTALRKHP